MADNFTPLTDDPAKKVPTNPISGHREMAPPSPKPETFQIEQVVEHKISDEEVKPHVEERKAQVELSPDLKDMGLEADQTTQFPTNQTVHLPISDDKVATGLHAPVNSSFRWLATLAMFILRQAHFTLKTIHGKVVRVPQK